MPNLCSHIMLPSCCGNSLIKLFSNSLIKKILIGHLHCSKHLEYVTEQNGQRCLLSRHLCSWLSLNALQISLWMARLCLLYMRLSESFPIRTVAYSVEQLPSGTHHWAWLLGLQAFGLASFHYMPSIWLLHISVTTKLFKSTRLFTFN